MTDLTIDLVLKEVISHQFRVLRLCLIRQKKNVPLEILRMIFWWCKKLGIPTREQGFQIAYNNLLANKKLPPFVMGTPARCWILEKTFFCINKYKEVSVKFQCSILGPSSYKKVQRKMDFNFKCANALGIFPPGQKRQAVIAYSKSVLEAWEKKKAHKSTPHYTLEMQVIPSCYYGATYKEACELEFSNAILLLQNIKYAKKEESRKLEGMVE